MAVGNSHRLQGKAADALVTLVQNCYPSATVLFTPTANNGGTMGSGDATVSGTLDALQTRLYTQRAAEQGLTEQAPGLQRFLALRHVVGPTPAVDAAAAAAAATSWWAPFYAVDSAMSARLNPPGLSSLTSLVPSRLTYHRLCCPDAVVYIDGVEEQDVGHLVAPTLIEAVKARTTPCSTVSATAVTHRGERQAPSYCRRKVDWAAIWEHKRCAMRGTDLLELSFPVSSDLAAADADVRERMLVSVANPAVTLADLQRQRNPERRRPLRTSFGFSLPCVQAAVPVAVIRAVRVVRRWQQQVLKCTPSTSAFWVSSFAHLLKTDVVDAGSPLTQQAEVCSQQRAELGLTATQVRYLSAIVQHGIGRPNMSEFSLEEETELLTFLLTSTVLHLASTLSLEAWNRTNYFLPAETFDSTRDAEVVIQTMRYGGVAHTLTFPIFSGMYRVLQR
ncbi:hypothetical protein JKF63_03232 [Porcisia hertigi]|uniref:Uncharacterized protein n=1 Tax=Porcisia hertigi TaxID=2761500 RepID=A0A836HYA5_9TRYP|nr:hypothetical protein JKF63_03232 [Porcisia hertigi]